MMAHNARNSNNVLWEILPAMQSPTMVTFSDLQYLLICLPVPTSFGNTSTTRYIYISTQDYCQIRSEHQRKKLVEMMQQQAYCTPQKNIVYKTMEVIFTIKFLKNKPCA